jgi:DNA-binding PadR family transcriptional regulator
VLSSLEFFVLLAVAGRARYGYAIQEQMVGDSVGHLGRSLPGIYAALRRLEQKGLVGSETVTSRSGPPRTEYHLTNHGRTRLRAEAETMGRTARLAKERT